MGEKEGFGCGDWKGMMLVACGLDIGFDSIEMGAW